MKTGATTWPNGSKIAVALTVMFETWPEGKWPPYAAQRWQPKPGALDHQSISFARYGGKAGIWRILNILDKAGMPATFCTNAHSVEVYPEAAAQVVKCGHDFAAHGYTQDAHLADMTAEQEQSTIRRCIERIDAGVVKANAPTTGTELHVPFGGLKDSTFPAPREQNAETVADFFTWTKSAYTRLVPE